MPLLLLTVINTGAQSNRFIGVSKQFHEKDTSRTFTLLDGNRDMMKDQLVQAWGTPVMKATGRMEWKKCYINAWGREVNIVLLDGIVAHNFKKRTATCTMFKDETDKNKRMSRLIKGQDRHTRIEFTDAAGPNDINTAVKEKEILDYLYETIKPG